MKPHGIWLSSNSGLSLILRGTEKVKEITGAAGSPKDLSFRFFAFTHIACIVNCAVDEHDRPMISSGSDSIAQLLVFFLVDENSVCMPHNSMM